MLKTSGGFIVIVELNNLLLLELD